ncbi:hypothetical protein V5F59_09535 [Xanthobacter autotrophicus DSM 431]|uniref:hypothetical protein n=1 Tax=Xanthobacter nonsaccharivorans TaxID=3119912 RepID=UPI00372B1371
MLENVRHPVEEEVVKPSPKPEQPYARPPGGILIVAILSAVSGAIMGFVFAGYLSLALTMLAATSLGIAIGMWVRGLSD